MVIKKYILVETKGFRSAINVSEFDTKDEALKARTGSPYKIHEIKIEVNISKAHEEFVTDFMKKELINSFGVPEDYADEVASNAYNIYCQGDGNTEYECIERAYDRYLCEQ